MKTITKEVVTKEVVGYEAFDGERFSTEEACLAYEKSGKAELSKRYNDALIMQTSPYYMFEFGYEDNYLDVLYIKDDATLFGINAYLSLFDCDTIDSKYLGKVFMIEWDYDHNYPCVIGTMDDYIENLKKRYEIVNKED